MAAETPRRRAPYRTSPMGLVLGGVAAIVFVGGTLWGVLSAEDAKIRGEQPRPQLTSLMGKVQLVVRGTATSVERLGQPRDAGVVANIEVDDLVVSPEGELPPHEVLIYDHGFRESWAEGQDVLLFLAVGGSLPGQADYRVRERCVFGDGALPCPYDVDDVRRAGAG